MKEITSNRAAGSGTDNFTQTMLDHIRLGTVDMNGFRAGCEACASDIPIIMDTRLRDFLSPYLSIVDEIDYTNGADLSDITWSRAYCMYLANTTTKETLRMKEIKTAVDKLTEKREEHQKGVDKYTSAIEALQSICSHNMVETSHDSHKRYRTCNICGYTDYI